MIEKITSVKNSLILKALEYKTKKSQLEDKKYLIEGLNIVNEAIKNNVVDKIFVTKKFVNTFQNIDVIEISDNVAQKLSDLKNSQEVFAICNIVKKDFLDSNVLILDDVQDPGNLGTLIRSAFAFGFNNIICSESTVFLFNSKVLRAIQGNHFDLNIEYCDLEKRIVELKNEGYTIISTNLKEKNSIFDFESHDKIALILGNEGNGVSERVQKLAQKNVILKTSEKIDSLNVAIAGSIIMHDIFNVK
ncbi:RNA methyltransferase, TrmH family [Spiroplasma helicoides]|uniref:RNA methyltransferase, TrmH family n=1 Tax=Spiroplasma helicoides TaxID=216938 RepID=A0A1B3SL78_9MOLU|nr:RNA methyltransferase [Spiroplasma helicoides]AOG60682.1 RNA methyltransferase, TrmH family [Spiroplasma helicoides]